jgi:hypothetical protein
MWPRRAADLATIAALATIVTIAIAAPVLRAPSERLFGMDIAGRHHDPFTTMRQFDGPLIASVYSQPVTDVTGSLLARLSGPVAAYNWLVLLSFPLSAVAAFLLARHLGLSSAGATLAAMAYAFSPFHLAQAAYHPHIAQTQWLPLYLLALWRCLDKPSLAAIGFLAAATAAVTLSNFYGGLIAAVITPIAIGAYWLAVCRGTPGSARRLGLTCASLVAIAAAGLAYAFSAAGSVVANRAAYGFPRADLFRYSAKWWSYLVPPIEHPMLGETAHRIWTAAGVREGLLEQQVSLGWGLVALGLIAIFHWLATVRGGASERSIARVPVLAAVAAAALLCSLSPERTIGAVTLVSPSAFFYDLVPMFRSYARFGVAVQLMAALLAGVAVDYLRRTGTTRSRIACTALVILAAGEYAVSPPAMWRDVLPTRAHRWVTRQPGRVHALDCAALTQESASVPWLTGDRITLLDGVVPDCAEPDLPQKLAANGYTHLIVRRGIPDSLRFDDRAPPSGLRVAARFSDGRVFAVTAAAPAVYTAAMAGFYSREHDGARSWRWMGADASWTVVNTGEHPVAASLCLELEAFQHPRTMEVRLDGHGMQTLVADPGRRMYQLASMTIGPGEHRLVFRAADAVVSAGGDDQRVLSFALGPWTWTTESEAQLAPPKPAARLTAEAR